MKIAYVSINARIPSRGASSIHIMNMCAAYASLGHEVTLYISGYNRNKKSKDLFSYYGVPENFKVKRIFNPENFLGELFCSLILFPIIIRRGRLDLLHARSISVAWSAARFFGMPVIYELHGAPDKNPRAYSMFQSLIKSKSFIGLISITRALTDYVRALIPAGTKLFIAPDGVPESMLESNVTTDDARLRLNIDAGGKRLAVYTGHLYPGRGIDLILEIATRLPEYLFYIVGGSDEDIEGYRKLAVSNDNIIFAGFRPPAEVRYFQMAADVLLMPYADRILTAGTNNNNTAAFASPLKMFEYMAAGRPIVFLTLPVLSEILKDGHNALMVPYGEPAKWVDALEKIRISRALADTLAQNALSDVRQFTWTKRAELIGYFVNKEI